MDHEEEWLPVVGWESLYEVSSKGQVRSFERQTRSGTRGGKLLAPFLRKDGYYEVQLFRSPELTPCPTCGHPQPIVTGETLLKKKKLVHHLVLESFVDPRPDGLEALHGPGGKQDNRPENLSWGKRSQNMGEDRVRDHQSNRGEHHGLTTLTWDQVCNIRAMIGKVPQNELARMYGVSKQTITNIKTGHTWAHPPEEW
jgi:NUMOD4 motif/HNH endonuclease